MLAYACLRLHPEERRLGQITCKRRMKKLGRKLVFLKNFLGKTCGKDIKVGFLEAHPDLIIARRPFFLTNSMKRSEWDKRGFSLSQR
jgi:hypothetical protein